MERFQEKGIRIIEFSACDRKIGDGAIRLEHNREEWLVWIKFCGETSWKFCGSLSDLKSYLIPEIHPGVTPLQELQGILNEPRPN